MNPVLATFQKLYHNFDSLITHLCQTNPKHREDRIKQESIDTRNRIIIYINIFLILVCVYDVVLQRGTLAHSILAASLCVLIITMVIASCRYHPQIFKIGYSVGAMLFAPSVVGTGTEGIHIGFFMAQNIPAFVYIYTGSVRYCLLQAVVQGFWINKFYAKLLEGSVVYMTPKEFTNSFVYASNSSSMFLLILVMLTDYIMNRTYTRLLTSEKKKDEFEKQKIFLLGFSHELRNLINSLTGNVKLASLENITGRAKELLLNAEVCGELLLHLVNNILDTGKTEIGDLEINPVPTKIYDSLERVWGICSELIKRKNLKGQMNLPNNMPRTMVIDHYRLAQIFLNLVGNAIKFTEKGFVDINVEWIDDQQQVSEATFKPYPFNDNDEHDEGLFEKEQSFTVFSGNNLTLNATIHKIKQDKLRRSVKQTGKGVLKIIVRDSGCGMSKEEISRLFQKFSQVTSDLSKKKLGTGLGLYITKELCQKMKGDIKVFSKKNKGSSFIFCIPVELVSDDHTNTHDLQSLKNLISTRNLQAMIVDDEPLSHGILSSFFRNLNIEVNTIAVNGLEAYGEYAKAIEERRTPRIVTMDLDMPIMDGKEASRRIREMERENGISPCFLLIISGNCSESEIEECLDKSGSIRANAFLKKPIRMEDLVRVIENNLSRFL